MIRDLLLGLRLAVGGGRMSGQALLRLSMTTLGVGLVVAILMLAASATNLMAAKGDRESGMVPVTTAKPGVDPLYRVTWPMQSGGGYFYATVVAPGGPDAPVPPGLDRLPVPGEIVASPAAVELLDSPEGAPARAQLGGKIVGEVGKAGLGQANDLEVFLGAPLDQVKGDKDARKIYGFGGSTGGGSSAGTMTMILSAPVAVILLLPLLVFVTTASRMGAAERERRLAALRLLGVSGKEVRRVAAGETLLGAVTGLVLGGALFYALRPLIGKIELFGIRYFAEDFVPQWPFVVGIVLIVPALAIGAAIFGLRRTVVEPLGVVRHSKPLRRRMWWRWAFTIIGAVLMGSTLLFGKRDSPELVGIVLAAGSAFLLVGVAALLPWLVERVVSRMRGGPTSWQLAVRRLQLESGTASRVVSGLVVVLAGTILIQTLIGALAADDSGRSTWQPQRSPIEVLSTNSGAGTLGTAERLLAADPAVREMHRVRSSVLKSADGTDFPVTIGNCVALAAQAELGSCSNGDVFAVGAAPAPGQGRFDGYNEDTSAPDSSWTVPDDVKRIPASEANWLADGALLITPGALGNANPSGAFESLYVWGPGNTEDVWTAAASAVRPLAWNVNVTPASADPVSSADETTEEIRGMLLAASSFVLAVAALSLLMLSVEQIMERRRPLAALSAAGIPLSVLARGSLWQNAIPVGVGVLLAIATGFGITLPIVRYARLQVTFDVGLVGLAAGAGVLAVLVTTALALPFLRQVTKLDGLRSE